MKSQSAAYRTQHSKKVTSFRNYLKVTKPSLEQNSYCFQLNWRKDQLNQTYNHSFKHQTEAKTYSKFTETRKRKNQRGEKGRVGNYELPSGKM